MILETNGQVFTVHIRYDEKPESKRVRRRTHVALHEGRCRREECPVPGAPPSSASLYKGNGFVWAIVPCSRNDEFVKAKGRKLALAIAMAAVVKDVSIRRGLWEDFRRKVGELPGDNGV